MLAGTDDHLTRLSPVILNLESTGLTHLESEIRVKKSSSRNFLLIQKRKGLTLLIIHRFKSRHPLFLTKTALSSLNRDSSFPGFLSQCCITSTVQGTCTIHFLSFWNLR